MLYSQDQVKVLQTLLDIAEDDNTIKMFDVRKRSCVKTYHGHSHWVKNVEILRTNPQIFVTSAFDGTIRVWDMNAGKTLVMRFLPFRLSRRHGVIL
jgi:WD40 repeat protein